MLLTYLRSCLNHYQSKYIEALNANNHIQASIYLEAIKYFQRRIDRIEAILLSVKA